MEILFFMFIISIPFLAFLYLVFRISMKGVKNAAITYDEIFKGRSRSADVLKRSGLGFLSPDNSSTDTKDPITDNQGNIETVATPSDTDELEKLASLKDRGMLSDSEYEIEKNKIINR